MVAKPLCPLYKNIIKPLDRARYPELRYNIAMKKRGRHGLMTHPLFPTKIAFLVLIIINYL